MGDGRGAGGQSVGRFVRRWRREVVILIILILGVPEVCPEVELRDWHRVKAGQSAPSRAAVHAAHAVAARV